MAISTSIDTALESKSVEQLSVAIESECSAQSTTEDPLGIGRECDLLVALLGDPRFRRLERVDRAIGYFTSDSHEFPASMAKPIVEAIAIHLNSFETSAREELLRIVAGICKSVGDTWPIDLLASTHGDVDDAAIDRVRNLLPFFDAPPS